MPSRSLLKLVLFAVASAFLAVSTALDAKGLRRYSKLVDEVDALKAKDAQLAEENLRLARDVDALEHDPRYQERVVREELGLIRPGDLVLELDEPEIHRAAPPLVASGVNALAAGSPRGNR
jgi:cell division protein FtsB